MNKHCKLALGPVAASCLLALGATGLPSHAQQLSNDAYLTTISIEVHPVAYLEFDGTPLLYLEIPPPDSTIPSEGVEFTIYGNAIATLSAAPDEFIQTAAPKDWLGKAVMGTEAIGYDIQVWFPNSGTPIQIATLPGTQDPTPPLSVDLTASGGVRQGSIHLVASHDWTVDGGLPLPGLYEGSIVLTLTADNI